jgi:hypothetical protein
MSADAAPITASAPRSSTLQEFEIMDELILREQIVDETAMSRRAFLQGTGLLLGFALTGASTESVFAVPASQVVENEVSGTFAPNGFIRINPNRRRDPGHSDDRDGTGGLHVALDASR